MVIFTTNSSDITTWKQFARKVRKRGWRLLKRLDDFPNPILVTGCQRSGTTMISRLITMSEGMVNYWFGNDDELAAALILSGYVNHTPRGRYCFQTTYLNECYHEYYEHKTSYKMIWVLRNPFSVVFSLLHNWKMFALNELFVGCGSQFLEEKQKKCYELFGVYGISRIRRACLSYNGKVSQLFELKDWIGANRILILDYDDIVKEKKRILPTMYRFIDLPYKKSYGDKIHTKNIRKASRLSKRDYDLIEQLCGPVYEKAKMLLSDL